MVASCTCKCRRGRRRRHHHHSNVECKTKHTDFCFLGWWHTAVILFPPLHGHNRAMNMPSDCGALEQCIETVTTGGDLPGPCAEVQPCQTMLIASTIPLMLSSRLPQIWKNLQLGHTGILSPITLTANLLGSAARIFTTIQDVSVACVFCLVPCSNFGHSWFTCHYFSAC